MLSELARAGFSGSELGNYGYMPTDPDTLKRELAVHNLALTGAWVTVRLYDASQHQAGLDNALQVAQLLAEVGANEGANDCVLNIGDDPSSVLAREQQAGRISAEHGLDEAAWDVYLGGIHKVASAVKRESGLRVALHHHGATYVETPAEIDYFLTHSDPEVVGLCLDTGHYALGGGDPVQGLYDHAERIALVHFKDFDPKVLEHAKQKNWTYTQMVGAGLFSELGQGNVNFAAILNALADINYQGWLVVEQDILPGMGEPFENAKRNRAYLRSLGL
jgi:inosose dehydratase